MLMGCNGGRIAFAPAGLSYVGRVDSSLRSSPLRGAFSIQTGFANLSPAAERTVPYISYAHSREVNPDGRLSKIGELPVFSIGLATYAVRARLTPIVRPPYWLKLSLLIADWASLSLSISTVPQPVSSPEVGSFVNATEETMPNGRDRPSISSFVDVRGILPRSVTPRRVRREKNWSHYRFLIRHVMPWASMFCLSSLVISVTFVGIHSLQKLEQLAVS